MATLLHQRRGQKNAWRAPADKTKFDRKAMRFESAKRPFWNAPTDGDANIVAGINPYVSAEDRESAHIEALKEFIEQFEHDAYLFKKYFGDSKVAYGPHLNLAPGHQARVDALAAGVMIELDADGGEKNPFYRDPTDHVRYKESKKEVARYYKEKHKEDEEKTYRKCFEQWCIGKNFLLNDRRITPWSYETLADRFPRVINYALQPVESTRKVHNYLFGLYMRSPQSEREIEIYFKYLVYPVHEALRKLQSINLNPDLTLDDLHAGDTGALWYNKSARKHNEAYTILGGVYDMNSKKYKKYWPPELVFLGFGRKQENKVPLSLDPTINRFMRPGIINAVSYKEYCEGDYSALSPDVRELWEFTNERMPGRDDRQYMPGHAEDTFAAAVGDQRPPFVNRGSLYNGGLSSEIPARRVARDAGLCRPVLGRQLRRREERRVDANDQNGALHVANEDDSALADDRKKKKEEREEAERKAKEEREKKAAEEKQTEQVKENTQVVQKNTSAVNKLVSVFSSLGSAMASGASAVGSAVSSGLQSAPSNKPADSGDESVISNDSFASMEDDGGFEEAASEVAAAAASEKKSKEKPPITGEYKPKDKVVSLDDYLDIHGDDDEQLQRATKKKGNPRGAAAVAASDSETHASSSSATVAAAAEEENHNANSKPPPAEGTAAVIEEAKAAAKRVEKLLAETKKIREDNSLAHNAAVADAAAAVAATKAVAATEMEKRSERAKKGAATKKTNKEKEAAKDAATVAAVAGQPRLAKRVAAAMGKPAPAAAAEKPAEAAASEQSSFTAEEKGQEEKKGKKKAKVLASDSESVAKNTRSKADSSETSVASRTRSKDDDDSKKKSSANSEKSSAQEELEDQRAAAGGYAKALKSAFTTVKNYIADPGEIEKHVQADLDRVKAKIGDDAYNRLSAEELDDIKTKRRQYWSSANKSGHGRSAIVQAQETGYSALTNYFSGLKSTANIQNMGKIAGNHMRLMVASSDLAATGAETTARIAAGSAASAVKAVTGVIANETETLLHSSAIENQVRRAEISQSGALRTQQIQNDTRLQLETNQRHFQSQLSALDSTGEDEVRAIAQIEASESTTRSGRSYNKKK